MWGEWGRDSRAPTKVILRLGGSGEWKCEIAMETHFSPESGVAPPVESIAGTLRPDHNRPQYRQLREFSRWPKAGPKSEGSAHLLGHFSGILRSTNKKYGSPLGCTQLPRAMPHASGRDVPSGSAEPKATLRILTRQPSCYFSDNRCCIPRLLSQRRDMVCR